MREDLEALIPEEEQRRLRRRAMGILERRALSRRELIDKLIQKGEEREPVEDTALWLEEMGLLNDADYAETVVRHYAGRGYGKLRIQQELYRRGIEKDLWEAAFAEMPEDFGALDRFIQSKLKGQQPDRREEKRVADALHRRGYDWDDISEGFRRYRERLEDDYAEPED